jgi:pimeloyl-ACP methyl ester carboxylesterase
LAAFIFSEANAQQVFKTTPTSVIGYLEYLPQGYNSNSNKYPIVIFLHGLGERGPNSTNPSVLQAGIAPVTRNGPPKHVKAGKQFPFILISPQLKNNFGDWPSWYVMEVVNYVKTYLRVDEKRIYLTGLSLGGGGTWWTAQDFPNVFAAIAPVCGSRNSTGKACTLAGANLPVWAFHGNKDSTVPMSRSVNMVNAINGCTPKPNPLAKLTIYPGIAHNAWDKAYMPDHSIHNPNVYEWMLSFVNKHVGGTTNNPPLANAGPDQTITLPTNTAVMTGTASDADGAVASYTWAKVAGGNATLAGTNTAKLTATNLAAGNYQFRLTVKDNAGATKSDDVLVTVKTSTTNNPPVVNAGPDKSITLPTNAITLTGSATDNDGTIASFAWTKVSGGAVVLGGANTAKLSLSGMVAGTYVFRLTAKDNKGASKSDDVQVIVNPAVVNNKPPVALAGPNITITLPVNHTVVNGGGSDPDGTVASYTWTKISGGAATLSGANSAKLTVSNLVAGFYVFRLTVKDNKGATASDDMGITVKQSTANTPPVVNAGADKTITLPSNSIALAGSASDPDGSIASLSWSKVSGGNVLMGATNAATLQLSSLVAGTYVFRLTAKDNNGALKSDDVMVTVKTAVVASTNKPPVALAGPNVTISLPTNHTVLYGGGTDSDGSIVSYNWTKVSGGSASLTYANTANVTISNLSPGFYVFRLTVKDNKGATAFDDTGVTVRGTTASVSSPSAPSVVEPSVTTTVASNQPSNVNVTVGSDIRTTSPVDASMEESPVENYQKFVLNSDDVGALKNYHVVVFNDQGQRIYHGPWEKETYQEVFREEGLYIYNIMQGNNRVDTGKIYIRQ